MEQTHEFCCSSPSKYAFTHVMLEEFLIFPSIFQNLKKTKHLGKQLLILLFCAFIVPGR